MSLHLSSLYTDGMVLQRDKHITIHGQAAAGSTVTVTFLSETYGTKADSTGAWSVQIGPYPFGGPYIMELCEGQEKIYIQDIYIGDVWLLAGQSNMELQMERVRHMYPEEMQADSYPIVRLFRSENQYALDAPKTVLAGGKWLAASVKTIAKFSAVGYFFAKRLYAHLGVPIGLISTAIGGTPIHTWMGKEMLNAFPAEQAESEKYANNQLVSDIQEKESAATTAYYDQLNERDIGLRENWASCDFTDTHWVEQKLDCPWDESMAKPGVLWFRKTLNIPQALAGKPATVFLGTIVDADTLYVNGIPVGTTPYRYPPREYQIPALPKGQCLLTLRVLNLYGKGEITPQKFHMLTCGSFSYDLNTAWRFCRGTFAKAYQQETNFANKPTAYFNGMIAPLSRFPIKGMLWYQGESDADNPQHYQEKFSALLQGWRALFGEKFPVIYAQLPLYNRTYGVDWNLMRREQTKCLKNKNIAMIYTADIGDYTDLHPHNKQAVGDRFARAALRIAYHKDLPSSPFELLPEPINI